MGSDGESADASPCTSDQMSTTSCYLNFNFVDKQQYIPNVKMRQKHVNKKWSEVKNFVLIF